jgi:hypothetical protein
LVEASTYLLTGDHDGTTELLSGMTSISACPACGQTSPLEYPLPDACLARAAAGYRSARVT